MNKNQMAPANIGHDFASPIKEMILFSRHSGKETVLLCPSIC